MRMRLLTAVLLLCILIPVAAEEMIPEEDTAAEPVAAEEMIPEEDTAAEPVAAEEVTPEEDTAAESVAAEEEVFVEEQSGRQGLYFGAGLRLPVRPLSFDYGIRLVHAGAEALYLPLTRAGFHAYLGPIGIAGLSDVYDVQTGENKILTLIPFDIGVRWYPGRERQRLFFQLHYNGLAVSERIEQEGMLLSYHAGAGIGAGYSLFFAESLLEFSLAAVYIPGSPVGAFTPTVSIAYLW
jgi:hypothetical protein